MYQEKKCICLLTELKFRSVEKNNLLLKLNNSNVVAQNGGWSVGLDRIKQLTYTLKTQNLMCIIFKHLVISSYCFIFDE